MIELWAYIDGERVSIPLCVPDAREFGWTRAVKVSDPIQATDVKAWCRTNFPQGSYETFIDGSVWFYRERDAMLCQLRWS